MLMHDVAPHRLVETASGLSGPWHCVCGENGIDAGYDHLDFYGALLRTRLSDDELGGLLRAGHSGALFPREEDHAVVALLDDGRWMPLLRRDTIVRWTPDGRPRASITWLGVRACLFDLAIRGVPQLLGARPDDADPGWTVDDGTYLSMILCVVSRSERDSCPISLQKVAGLPRIRRLLLADLVEHSWLTRRIPGQQDFRLPHHQHILDAVEASLRFGSPVQLYTLREVPAGLRLQFGQRLMAALSSPAA
ncbi:hypothetical protein DMB66_37945 [Actinoplanes sp. ATCC 53533]|nr:hypothetical protein DMB66_37945 [Actinoplanes sp. ATCC 53533]